MNSRSQHLSPDARPRILVVDDDEDTRQLIAFALGENRYAVTEVVDGGSALAALRAGSFDLVITDYDMPGMTGAEMLRRATAEAVIGNAAALVVTAHDDPKGLAADTPLMHKPLDLERLLLQERAILPEQAIKKRRVASPSSQRKGAKSQALELVLYVSPHSPASLKAQHRMKEVLADFEGYDVHFEVYDLIENAASAERDRVVFTPTLVKRSPDPRAWIVGDLTADNVVRDLLTMCGISRREDPPA